MSAPEWETYLPLVLLSLIALGINLWLSRKHGSYALLHPNGLFSAILFLHAIGFVIVALRYGRWPVFFGLHQENLYPATLMLISGQVGLLVGTILPRKPVVDSLPKINLSPVEVTALEKFLAGSIVLFSIPNLIGSFSSLDALSQAHYGGDQDFGKPSQFISSLYNFTSPSFNALVFARMIMAKNIYSRGTIFLAILTAFPTLVGGGRRNVLITVGIMLLASVLRSAKIRFGRLAIYAVILVSLSSLIVLSRSGETLDPNARIETVLQAQEEMREDPLDHTLLLFSGNTLMTAAIRIFPEVEPFSFGSTYLKSLVNVVVPSSITGSFVFQPPNELFRQAYYRDSSGIGLDYLLAAEGYQNFGYFGPFLAFLGVGFLLSVTFDAMKSSVDRKIFDPMALVHLQCFVISIWCLRTDSNAYFKLMIYGSIWVFLLAMLARVWATGSPTVRARR